MKEARFYFISDTFYLKYDTEKMLMQNKETINGQPFQRPCFFAFSDKKNNDIYWCIPISSRVEKYKKIVEHKIQRQRDMHKKHPQCNTIRFGEVLGQKRAFLIQNMFPVTQNYIESVYIDKNTQNEVTVSPEVEKDVVKNARHVLKASYKIPSLIYGDVHKIYDELSAELQNSELSKDGASTSTEHEMQFFKLRATDQEIAALEQAGIKVQQCNKGKESDGKTAIRFDIKDKDKAKETLNAVCTPKQKQ